MFRSFKNSDVDFSKLNDANPYFHVIEAVGSFLSLKGLKVLDVGCGREQKYQVLGNELARLGCLVTGIDPDCKPGGTNPFFVRSSIDEFITNEKFDVIISSYFFGYVTKDWALDGLGKNPRDYEAEVMEKIHGMLRPGGISIHYMNEPWALSKEDLKTVGFEILKFPEPIDLFHVKDGLCILRKK